MEKKTYGIVIKQEFDSERNQFRIANFDNVKAECERFIKDNSLFLNIADEKDFKWCKEERAESNKVLKQIQATRLAVNEAVLGLFNDQLKEIERMLKDNDLAHKVVVDKWKEEHTPIEEKEEKTYKLVVITLDEKVANQIEKYATKLSCKVRRE